MLLVTMAAAFQVPDLFQRDLTAAEPGRKYMGDIIYLPGAGGEFLHRAASLRRRPGAR